MRYKTFEITPETSTTSEASNRAPPEKLSKRDRTKRRVVCAALRASDGSLLLGVRHYSQDMHDQIQRRSDGTKFIHRTGEDQGFVDQWGCYMTRAEAFVVASNNRQIYDLSACQEPEAGCWELFSEALY